MRIHVLSDLHIEFGAFVLPETDADVIVLAGDTHVLHHGVVWALEQPTDKPIVYVLGNHEFYGGAYPKLIHNLRKRTAGTNVHILERESFVHEGVRFLGCTLWTDFALFGTPVYSGIRATSGMTDFRRIRHSPTYTKFRSKTAASVHASSRSWLGTQCKDKTLPTVIVTHHCPSARSLPDRFANDALSPAYASHADDFVEHCGAALWVHGHVHHSCDFKVGPTQVLCNPRGYADEPSSDFDPAMVVCIPL